MTQATYSSSTSTWSSFIREQWFYRNSDDPYEYKQGSDAPLLRRIDENGDGTFEKSQHFVTDRQGSVVAVLDEGVEDSTNGSKPGNVIAYVKYDRYGTPKICDPADIDRDGVVDLTLDLGAYITAWQAWKANDADSPRYKELLDFDKNGVVDPDGDAAAPSATNADYVAFSARLLAALSPSAPTAAEVLGRLPLYCGYWWDGEIGMYHVRHRVYRPEWGRWIQRDPLGYAAGWNLYEYCGGEPWREIDPTGLIGLGDVVNWYIDGASEALDVASDHLFGTDRTGDRKHRDMLDKQNKSLAEKVVRLVESGAANGDKVARDFMYFLSQQRSDMAGVSDIRGYEWQRIKETAIDAALTAVSGPLGRGLGLAGKALLSRVIGRTTATYGTAIALWLSVTFKTPIATAAGEAAGNAAGRLVSQGTGYWAGDGAVELVRLVREALKALGRKKVPATMIGAKDTVTGDIAVGLSGGGSCAENAAVDLLGGNPSNIKFTVPTRVWDENRLVPVCERCRDLFDPRMWPPGTPFRP